MLPTVEGLSLQAASSSHETVEVILHHCHDGNHGASLLQLGSGLDWTSVFTGARDTTVATKWLLLTFGEGSRGYRSAARRLVEQATATDMFDDAIAVDGSYLRRHFPDFWDAHGAFMKSHPRGFGYWIWKPFIIHQFLESLPEGWAVAYLDAGCVLNDSGPARARLDQYKNHALEKSVWATELVTGPEEDFTNETWCEADALEHLGASDSVRKLNQVQAGILMMAKDSLALGLLGAWHEVSVEDSYHFLDDSQSKIPNSPSFRDHRHDQALFNIIFRQLGLQAIPDETFFPGKWLSDGEKFPIWAARWTYRVPFRPNGPRPLRVKLETMMRLGLAGSLMLVWRRMGSSKNSADVSNSV